MKIHFGKMLCRCTEEHCITKNHSKYFGGPKHLYISSGNLPSTALDTAQDTWVQSRGWDPLNPTFHCDSI